MQRFITALLTTLALAGTALAEDKIDVDVDTAQEPAEVIGLVISSSGTAQRLNTSYTRPNDGTLTVTVPLKSGERGDDTVVTAMVVGKDGSVTFGNSKATWQPALSSSMYSIPTCSMKKLTREAESQMGLFDSLVQNRLDQRKILQQKTSQILQGDFQAKLAKLERGFGLERGQELSPNLPPLELVDRLDRLIQAIQSYKAARAAKPVIKK